MSDRVYLDDNVTTPMAPEVAAASIPREFSRLDETPEPGTN